MAVHEVPLRTKLLYGSGEVTISAKNAALNQFLLFFCADVVHLSPALVSAAIFLGKLWDAVTDTMRRTASGLASHLVASSCSDR